MSDPDGRREELRIFIGSCIVSAIAVECSCFSAVNLSFFESFSWPVREIWESLSRLFDWFPALHPSIPPRIATQPPRRLPTSLQTSSSTATAVEPSQNAYPLSTYRIPRRVRTQRPPFPHSDLYPANVVPAAIPIVDPPTTFHTIGTLLRKTVVVSKAPITPPMTL